MYYIALGVAPIFVKTDSGRKVKALDSSSSATRTVLWKTMKGIDAFSGNMRNIVWGRWRVGFDSHLSEHFFILCNSHTGNLSILHQKVFKLLDCTV